MALFQAKYPIFDPISIYLKLKWTYFTHNYTYSRPYYEIEIQNTSTIAYFSIAQTNGFQTPVSLEQY